MQAENTRSSLSKVPAVTLGFWLIKIAATTLGETGGDTVSMSLNLGYLVGTAIFLTALVVLDPKARSEMLSAGTDVQRYLENEFARRNHLLGANRQVKRLAVIDDAFTVENGLMTSTLKLRRARIQDAYQDVIERLYKD